MAAPVAGQKHDPVPIKGAEAEFVGGLAERARDPAPLDIGDPVDAIKAAAADYADNPAGHRSNLVVIFNALALVPSRLLRLPCGPPRNGRLSLSLRAKRSNLVVRWLGSVDARPNLALGGIKEAGRDDQEQKHLEPHAVPLVEVGFCRPAQEADHVMRH